MVDRLHAAVWAPTRSRTRRALGPSGRRALRHAADRIVVAARQRPHTKTAAQRRGCGAAARDRRVRLWIAAAGVLITAVAAALLARIATTLLRTARSNRRHERGSRKTPAARPISIQSLESWTLARIRAPRCLGTEEADLGAACPTRPRRRQRSRTAWSAGRRSASTEPADAAARTRRVRRGASGSGHLARARRTQRSRARLAARHGELRRRARCVRADSHAGDYTSTTNIGLHLIDVDRARSISACSLPMRRATAYAQTLDTLDQLETDDGLFFNYYDTTSLERTQPLRLRSSTQAWLSAGLMVVRMTLPEFYERCAALIEQMHFRTLLRPPVPISSRTVTSSSRAGRRATTTASSTPRRASARLIAHRQRRCSGVGVVRDDPHRSRPHCRWQSLAPVEHAREDGARAHVLRRLLRMAGRTLRAVVGRQHVRGADAGAGARRGGAGTAQPRAPTTARTSLVQQRAARARPRTAGVGPVAERDARQRPIRRVRRQAARLARLSGRPGDAARVGPGARRDAARSDSPTCAGSPSATPCTASTVSTTQSTRATGQVAYKYLTLDQSMIFLALANHLADHAVQKRFAAGSDHATRAARCWPPSTSSTDERMASVAFEHVEQGLSRTAPTPSIDCSFADRRRRAGGAWSGPPAAASRRCCACWPGSRPSAPASSASATASSTSCSPQERNVAMVFQDYALYPFMTVRKNLEFPLKMRAHGARRDGRARRLGGGGPRRWPAARSPAQAALRRTAPARRHGARPGARARRCRCSTSRSRTSTPSCASRCAREIADLQRRTHTTMIYVTHDQTEAMTLGHRIAVLDRGRLQQVAPPQELYDRPANAFVAGVHRQPADEHLPSADARERRGKARSVVAGQTLPVDPSPEMITPARQGCGPRRSDSPATTRRRH